MASRLRATLDRIVGRRPRSDAGPAQVWLARAGAVALGLVAAASSLLVRYALLPELGEAEPFVPLFPLIVLSTLVGGGWAGAACLIGALAAAWYLFLGWPRSFGLAPYEFANLVSAFLAGGVIVALCVVLRNSVAEARAAAEHERTIAREFAHRMRNTLTLVMAISRRTFTPDRPLDQARRDFDSRLAALAGASAVVLESSGEDAGLQEVVAGVLAPFGYGTGEARIVVGGPAVRVAPETATILALILHELATNAVKYGALSSPSGRVELHWRVAASRRRELRLSWRESGGPPVVQPERRGLGSILIERYLADTPGGGARLEFAPEGVRAEIKARLD